MFNSETTIRVRYAETDQMNVVYHGNYAQYFEVARAEAIRELGFTYKEMEASGVVMPIVELHTKFLRPAKYDDLLTIKTQLREMLTIGRIVLYFLDAKTMARSTMPEALAQHIQPYFS
jgi:acyl-CoA thioester hydrolase